MGCLAPLLRLAMPLARLAMPLVQLAPRVDQVSPVGRALPEGELIQALSLVQLPVACAPRSQAPYRRLD